ncbi:unnamed protein product [Urochloa humidicola]
MASASTSPMSPSLSGQLLVQVPSPRMGRLSGTGTRQRSPLSVAVSGAVRSGQQPVQGNGGGGGKVHATSRPALMVVGGGRHGQPPAEGSGGSGGNVHDTPAWALMAVGGTAQLDQLPAEGTGGGGGKIHAVPAAAPAAKA